MISLAPQRDVGDHHAPSCPGSAAQHDLRHAHRFELAKARATLGRTNDHVLLRDGGPGLLVLRGRVRLVKAVQGCGLASTHPNDCLRGVMLLYSTPQQSIYRAHH